MRCSIVASFRFEGFHCWPAAPPVHDYLASKHRHVFWVAASLPVAHGDRDAEFIDLGRRIRHWVAETYGDPADLGSRSCEQLAYELVRMFDLESCTVSEDGENGATVHA